MQRDNLRKRENDKTAAKAGISPSPFGFPSAHPFPTPTPTLPAFAFYYSAEVVAPRLGYSVICRDKIVLQITCANIIKYYYKTMMLLTFATKYCKMIIYGL